MDELQAGAANVANMADFAQKRMAKQAGGKPESLESFSEGFKCNRTGIVFPKLYRAHYPVLDLYEGRSEPVHDGSFFLQYQLTPAEQYANGSWPGVPQAKIEAFQVLSDDDKCWLEVFAFPTRERAEGFRDAALRFLPEAGPDMITQGPSGFFCITARQDKPNLYGLITYHTIGAIEMPGMSKTVDAFYSTTIDRAGVVTPADPLPD